MEYSSNAPATKASGMRFARGRGNLNGPWKTGDSGLGFKGLGFKGLGFRVKGLGFRA